MKSLKVCVLILLASFSLAKCENYKLEVPYELKLKIERLEKEIGDLKKAIIINNTSGKDFKDLDEDDLLKLKFLLRQVISYK